ncbi:zinc-dependent metalloprotease [Hyphobacterium sp. SN044]|uniref:reprolysin-like metallopeptidase n=1 Tax=Hyphobacterium sp. SN044 TaxID=2912575 RepID=UPI001F3F130C|nr:M12 family metallo-peptidase [Hyphobacterium sp. SN044]MCF8879535.1 zinc-dependent metalloprotease [Hyphobacterium sp. SN044]
MMRFVTGTAIALALSAGALADDMFVGARTAASDDGFDVIEFDALAPGVMRMQPGETIDLNFGSGYEAVLNRIDTQELGGQVWVGELLSEGDNRRVLLTEFNGAIFGRVNTPDGEWYILSDAVGRHQIMRMPDNAFRIYNEHDAIVPNSAEVMRALAEREAAEGPQTAEAVAVGSNGTIDIALFYSNSFAAQWGISSGGRVQYLFSILDQALIDSDTGLRARLVQLQPVALTTDNASQGTTLNNLSNLDPGTVTQDLSSLRNTGATYGADLVGILQRCQGSLGSAGLAYLLGGNSDVINAGSAVAAYSVSADWIDGEDANLNDGFGVCGDVTFAHEIGHNMGFAHDRNNSTAGSAVRDFAHGFIVAGNYRTIMSYPSGQAGEQQMTVFSNPEIMTCRNNSTCGSATENAARAAREESLNIVNFRAEIPRVVSAVLPVTRSVVNGAPATAFATIINPASSGSTATGCGLRLPGSTGAQFSYQTTTPANALTGTANTPVDIPAGGSQNFLFSVTSASTFADNTPAIPGYPSANNDTQLFIEAFCGNRRSGEYTLGLNSLTFSSSAAATADVIALAATIGNTGRVDVPTTGNQVGVFSVAVSNVGTGASITATPDLGGRTIAGVNALEICVTDPGTGACTSARAASQTVTINNNATATFGVFVRGNGTAISNDPARNRVFVRFTEGGTERGATSVAVRTQ